MRLNIKAASLLFYLLVVFSIRVSAQVTLSPTVLFFENNFSSIILINNSNSTQEILVDFLFGYPVSDEFGRISMKFDEFSQEELRWDISQGIRAFPRAVTLQAGQRQVVRLSIRPTAEMPDGIHYSRIRITSTPETQSIGLEDDSAIGAQLNFVFEQYLAVYYRKGNVSGTIEATNIEVVEHEDAKLAVYDIRMMGSQVFLGTIGFNLTDDSGASVFSTQTATSVFRSEKRSFSLPNNLPPGNYVGEISFSAARQDVPQNYIIPFPTSTFRKSIQIN